MIKIKDAASKKYDYVFAHAEISGFKYNNGMLIKNEVSKTDFLSIGKMYSGHIHKKQEFSNIVYVGTPYQLDWADVGEKKGFYILDVVDGNETFIENEISPRFVEYRLEDIMELNISEVKKLLDNNYVNLYAQGSTLRKFGVKMFLDYLIENGSTHRKIELKPIYEIVKDDNVIEVSTGMDLVSIGREFLKSKDYKEDESSDILSYFSELYSKAKKI